jgi:hypothetical protein
MPSISTPHTAPSSANVEKDTNKVPQSFFPRVLTLFRLWRSRFKRKDRKQVATPESPPTTDDRVSDTDEVATFELDEYLATPTALTSPSYSLRSSWATEVEWAFNIGGGSRAGLYLQSVMPNNGLGLEGVPSMTTVDTDGVLPVDSSPNLPRTEIKVCPLRWWASGAHRIGLGFAFRHLHYTLSRCNSSHTIGSRGTSGTQ